jgi:DNA-binding IclR family transcriptional regulator
VREEFAEGLSSVAAAVTGPSGAVVGAVHVHGPSYRFPPAGAESDIARAVVESADRVSARLRQP